MQMNRERKFNSTTIALGSNEENMNAGKSVPCFLPLTVSPWAFFRRSATGSATVPVAVFGVAPKTRQPTDLPNAVPGAKPETARETRALPPQPVSIEPQPLRLVPQPVSVWT
jgi:hypothetical protein